MLLVRGGLTGNWVVKVEMTPLGLIFSACAVVSFGCTTVVATFAVRAGDVSAGTNAATTDFSSRVVPATDGTTTGVVPDSMIRASRGVASTPAAAAAARTTVTSLASSTTGAKVPVGSGRMVMAGAKAAGGTAKDL